MRSGQGKDITVNINDWMARRQNAFNPNDGFHAGVVHEKATYEELEAEAERRQKEWIEKELRKVLEPKLQPGEHECSECEKTGRFYKDDYMCYECRDKLDK